MTHTPLTKKSYRKAFEKAFKKERYEKVVEWEEDKFGFFQSWVMAIFIAIFYPIFYIQERRKVSYIKIK